MGFPCKQVLGGMSQASGQGYLGKASLGGYRYLESKPTLPGWRFFCSFSQGMVAATQFCVALAQLSQR